ncbi:MAG: hypothetical protein Q4F65_05750 [Propionibacteriaceae bacterium]|nr:hypothetical protein [Propionibacteriaceae bacterium]
MGAISNPGGTTQGHPDAAARGVGAGVLALWAATAGYAALLVWQGFVLPEAVPGHIGPDGGVTRWGSRTEHLIVGTVLGAVMVAAFALPAVFIHRIDAAFLNVPHKEYWLRPEHRPAAQRMLADDMGWMGAATLVFIGFMMWQLGEVARGRPFPSWVLWAATGVFVAGVVAYSAWMSKGSRWRPPADGDLRR